MRRVEHLFERFTAKDVDAVVEMFAPDGVFSDPHYPPPVGPTMVGHDAIRQGITMGLGMLDRPGFRIRHRLSADGDAGPVAVEVDTNHELVGGTVAAFAQVFIVELDGDGRFRRVQSYTPYPPPSVP